MLQVTQLEDRTTPSVVTNYPGLYTDGYGVDRPGIHVDTAYFVNPSGLDYEVVLDPIQAMAPSCNWINTVQAAFPNWGWTVAQADPANLELTIRTYKAYGNGYAYDDPANTAFEGNLGGAYCQIEVATNINPNANGTYRWIQVYTTNAITNAQGGVTMVSTAQSFVDNNGNATPYYPLSPNAASDQRGLYDQPDRPPHSSPVIWNAETYLVEQTAANTVTVFPGGFTWGWQTSARNLTGLTVPTMTASSDPNPSQFAQDISINTSVTTSGSSNPSGAVTFFDATNRRTFGHTALANLLGEPETSIGNVSNIAPQPGRSKIKAVYSGDAELAGQVFTFWHTFNLPRIGAINSPLVFPANSANPLVITEPDEGDVEVQLTLSVTHGDLTLSGTTGLDFSFSDGDGQSAGDGTSDTTMTFRGTISDINAALDGLVFDPDYNYVGNAYLDIVTHDLGNAGFNGPMGDDDTLTIDVQPLNDAPVNSVPGSQTTNEDTAKVFSFLNSNIISIADADAGSSSVRVTLTGTNGVVTLGGTSGLTFTTGDGTSDGTMTFTGTISNINTALSGLSFAPTANFNGSASLQIVTNDLGNTGWGGALTDTDTISITVNSVNDNPVNSVPGAQTTTKNVNLVFSAANGNLISVGDVDIGSAIMQISLMVSGGTLSLSGTTGLNFSFSDSNGMGTGDGTSDMMMTFRGTLADVNAALAGLTFIPTTNYTGSASISITTKDLFTGSSGFDMDGVTITINP